MTSKRDKDRKRKREAQVNVRLTPEFYRRLQKACELQEHKEGQLIRILVEWALPFYEKSESVKGLKGISEPRFLQELEQLGRAPAVFANAEQGKERSA